MALFTDGSPSAIEDLRCYESSLLDVARVEQIDLDGKLALAAAEVGAELAAFLLRRPAQDPQAGSRRQLGLTTVVVTDPVKRWHVLHTLELVFRDAFGNQLNERYEKKRNQYAELTERAKRQALEYGVGLVSVPIPRAAAPACASVPGSGVSTTYYVSASWVGAREGAASYPTTFDTTAGSQLMVSTGAAPSGVTGWNVYVGVTREGMALQNSTPLSLGQAWVPTGGLVAGAGLSSGQPAEYWVIENRTSQRG